MKPCQASNKRKHMRKERKRNKGQADGSKEALILKERTKGKSSLG
jgi:hypothetical protein